MGAGARTIAVAGVIGPINLRGFVGFLAISGRCGEGCSGRDFRENEARKSWVRIAYL